MCGICGVVHFDGTSPDADVIEAMNATLLHRGPDQGRVLVDGPCGLGNRRLAILDLSPAGALPMQTADGRLTVAYNGEIYNYPELKALLESQGVRLRSNSDTESLLELYRREGANALQKLRGMFAFALWDRDERRLLLARDRLGKKPLYYYHDDQLLVFASEIKALLTHPAVPRESALDSQTLALYLGYGYIPAPRTAFKHIQALLPGHRILVGGRDSVNPVAYWTPPHAAGDLPVESAREEEYVQAVRETLEESVRLRLLSDVPLGAFLSGGLDSSLIVALMKKHSSGAVKTFSIGFAGDDSFDETPYAKQVAEVLETEHTAFTVQPDALDLLPKLVWHHDQPFADSSAIPTFLVSELTREHVTVALNGDGGDELFAGYERFYAASLVGKLGVVPRAVWKSLSSILKMLPEGTGYYNVVKRARRFVTGASLPLERAYFDWVRLFSADSIQDLISMPDYAGQHFSRSFANGARGVNLPALLDANLRTYLPDDLLVKADRCSMAASLEARSPFLDHKLVELAADIPVNLKLNGSTTKVILKKVARGLLPDAIIDRPKHGFGVPLGAWLRKDIDPVRDILLSSTARARGLLNPAVVETLIAEHAGGQRDHGQRLWTLLTLEWWFRLYLDTPVLEHP